MRRILILLVAVPALGGCGGGKPAVAPTVADRLAKQADAVAATSDPCIAARHAVALQAATIRAINAHAIPARYQEELQGRVNELVAELQPSCLPTPPAQATSPPPAPVQHGPGAVPPPRALPPGWRRGHGHGHDHGGHD